MIHVYLRPIENTFTSQEEERVVHEGGDHSATDGRDDGAPEPVLVSEGEDCRMA